MRWEPEQYKGIFSAHIQEMYDTIWRKRRGTKLETEFNGIKITMYKPKDW